IGNVVATPELRGEHRRAADDAEVNQLQKESDLTCESHRRDGRLAFLPDEHHAKHVQARKGELLDDDGYGEFTDVVEIVGVAVIFPNFGNYGQMSSDGGVIIPVPQ